MTRGMPTDPNKMGTPKPEWLTTSSSEWRSSNDDTEDEDYVCYMPEWLGHDPDCKRSLAYEMIVLGHHLRTIMVTPISQQTVNQNLKLFIEAPVQITAPMYTMCEVIVQNDTQLGNILSSAKCILVTGSLQECLRGCGV